MTGAYNASKFALEAVADAWRVELRPWGVKVVLIEPAMTDTDLWQKAPEVLEAGAADMSAEHQELYADHLAGMRKTIPRGGARPGHADGPQGPHLRPGHRHAREEALAPSRRGP